MIIILTKIGGHASVYIKKQHFNNSLGVVLITKKESIKISKI